MLFCVHVCIQLCTHVYTVVYTRVHRGVHYYFTTSFRGSLLLYGWVSLCIVEDSPLLYGSALIYAANGLSSARQKGWCQLGGWTPLCTTEGFVLTL